MRTGYDSVTPGNIPADAQVVGGYVDGIYAWPGWAWDRFGTLAKVYIAVHASTNNGNCLDVEAGDATPAQAPGWVRMRRAAGVDPSVYCSLAVWPQVRDQFIAQGVPEPHYWIAAYPGIGFAVYGGSVAHQYGDPGPFDVSAVLDDWPGVDHGAPTPEPTFTGGDGMLLRDGPAAGNTLKIYWLAGGVLHWTNGDEYAILHIYTRKDYVDLDNPLRIVQLARLNGVDDATITDVTGIPL